MGRFCFEILMQSKENYVEKRIITANGLRAGDVALCCACGKAILLARCYGQVLFLYQSIIY
jgi:hypothetical protein